MFQRHPIQNQALMFVTTNIKNRWPLFKDPVFAREAVDALYRVQCFNPFFLYGFVIMPDHCHFLLHVPEHGSISYIMQMYKRAVSFGVDRGPIWQTRFHMRVPDNAGGALRYIHLNPVRAGLCQSPEEYKWSSAWGRWDVMELG